MSQKFAKLIIRFLELQQEGLEIKEAAIQACEELDCEDMEVVIILLLWSDYRESFIEWAQKRVQ